jgi:hypothetical protein
MGVRGSASWVNGESRDLRRQEANISRRGGIGSVCMDFR